MTLPTVQVEIDFTTNLAAGLAYYEQVAATGPYVWYRLQETSGTAHTDASGNGITGTGNDLTLDRTSGKPVSGETASRYVDMGTNGRISFTPPAATHDRITIEAWIRCATLDGSASTYRPILEAANTLPLQFAVRGDGRLVFTIGQLLDARPTVATTNAVISAATWYHVGVVVDAPNYLITFYVNGAVVASGAMAEGVANSFAAASSPWYWGNNAAAPNVAPVTQIAEPALYLSLLDGGTFADHYAAATSTPFAGYTWTDVSDYVLANPGVSRRFGRQSSIEEVAPMELSYVLVNDDRRFEVDYAASPYANVEPGRPTRIRMAAGGNFIPNGGFETDLTGWTAFAGATISRQSFGGVTFGTWNMRVITDGLTSAEGAQTTGINVLPNATYTFSAYVLEGSSANLRLVANEYSGGGFVVANPGSTFVGDGVVTRRSVTFTTGATTDSVQLFVLTVGTQAKTFYVEGAQLETGSSTRAYVDTNGTADGSIYDWAFGFIEDFPQTWDESGLFGRVQIVAHDFMERMNQASLHERRFTEHLSGTRMGMLANIAGVPSSFRDIDAGAFSVMEQSIESGTVGDHARQVARTDRGLVFFDGRGYMVFQDGDYRTSESRSTTSQGTLGRSGSDDIETLGAPEFHAPSKLILNEITVRRPGGVDQTVSDSTSRAKFGPRSHSDELLLPTDELTATRAAALLADYKEPVLRVRAIRFNPAKDNKWSDALGVQMSDRYTWQFHPQQGWLISRDVFVEGVEDRWVGAEYVATWFLSPAPLPVQVAGGFRGLLALTS